MNPQQNSSSPQDKEPAINLPEIPAAPPAVAPTTSSSLTPPPAPTNLPDPSATPAGVQPTTAPTSVTPGPATAADVDVIEKEWVDKADEVVKKTVGDPHAEEEGVEELQTDYLEKRYDHKVDKSQEG
jgi:hypothetical protein